MNSTPEFYGMYLQPRPDRYTGLPRRNYVSSAPVRKKKGKALEPPTAPPPPGYGPALEWEYTSRQDSAGVGVIICSIIALFATAWTGGELDWMSNPIYWIVFALIIGWMAYRGDAYREECGADWYRSEGAAWIDLYKITKIKCNPSSSGSTSFFLTDHGGQTVRVVSGHPPAMWALILNGIEHSVVHNGATLDRKAEYALALRMPGPRWRGRKTGSRWKRWTRRAQ